MEVSPGGGRGDGHDLVGRTIGHYVVESKIGKGGMGEVFLARDTRLPRHVALKRMAPELRDDPDYRRRFEEEASRASQISDHRIASVFDVLDETDEIFLVMEYVPGPTLRERLRGPIDVPSFLPLALECTEALAAAHRSGIVHRDVKPENYVIGARGAVKLLDLGVAKALPRSEGESTVPVATQPTQIGGTPAYMAPEALLGVRSDFRSDIFSLGVMFYEMLSGEHPFLDKTTPATQDRILHHEPRPLATVVPKLPVKLDRLVTHMLAKGSEHRPSTAHDVLHSLLEIREHLVPPTRLQLLVNRIARHRAASMIGAAALAAAVVLIVTLLPPAPPLPDDPRVRLLTFTSSQGNMESRLVAAGITSMLEPTLRRLTASNAFDAVPREGRRFRPLHTVTRDPLRPRTTLALAGDVSENRDGIEVRLAVQNRADSSRLRSAKVQALRTEPLALLEQTVQAAAHMLEVDMTPEELAVVWRPSTLDNAAFSLDLRGRGYLLAAEAPQDFQAPSTSLSGPQGAPESDEDRARIRAAYLDSAEAAYGRACARDSMDADAWFGRALARWKKQQGSQPVEVPPQVLAWCQRALQLQLDHAESHALLGECYAAAKRDPAAIEELERALTLNPTDVAPVLKLAQLYERQARWSDIASLYQRQIRLFPRSYYWYSWNATFYFRRAEYDSAVVYYQMALDREPEEESALAGMGATCLMQGRYESAIPYLRAAIEQKPSALRLSNLGNVLFLTRRLAAAESAYAQAVALNPNYYMLWGNLGDSRYWNRQARDRAPEAYRRAITLAIGALGQSPSDRLIRARLAYYHCMIGDFATGRAELRRALAGKADHEVLYKAALAFNRLAETDSAFVYLRRALDAGFSPLWVKETPELDNLRTDPRFERL